MLLDKLVNRKKKGFTLVELMVVVVIIGVLVAIAIPIFRNVQRNAALNAHRANLRTLRGSAQIAIAELGTPASSTDWPTTDSGEWAWSAYLDEWPAVPDLLQDELNAETYTVTIGTDGVVTIDVPELEE